MTYTYYVGKCFDHTREQGGKRKPDWYNCVTVHNIGPKSQELAQKIDDCTETFIKGLYNIHEKGGFNLSRESCGETWRCNSLLSGRIYTEHHNSHRLDISVSLLEHLQSFHIRMQLHRMNPQMVVIS